MQFDNNSKYSITIDYLDITFQASIFFFFFWNDENWFKKVI